GGAGPVLSLGFAGAGRDYTLEIESGETPETLACRAWARQLLDQCLLELEGVPTHVAALRLRLQGADYKEICERTRLSDSTAQLAVHRLSREFGEILGRRLRELCPDPGEFEAELSEFMELLKTNV